uniref:DDE Tnp4 domain-containing protein n=1 Tax=Hucho hucho TaxID=62062 RepID=A0A4W5PKK9_9TELE
MVGARIAWMDTNYRESISPVERLAICLRMFIRTTTFPKVGLKSLFEERFVFECAFGILAARWRMYRRVLGLSPSNVDACVKATCVLHNYMQRSFQEPLQMETGTPNGHLPDVTRAGGNNAPRQAPQVREKLTTYFSSPAGEVPWQYAWSEKALLRAP